MHILPIHKSPIHFLSTPTSSSPPRKSLVTMSTDLEFVQGLPQLRLPTIRINPAPPSDTAEGGSDECHTPTSPENKIPATLTCPPAPKKPPRRAVSCKRKLCELEFFEIVGREEVESFFRLVDVNSSAVIKRRCPDT